MKKVFLALISVIVLFSIFLFSALVCAKTTFITIGTGGLTGVYYPTGGAIAKIVNKQRKEYGIRCTVKSTDGSVYNANAVIKGELDFGIVQSDRQHQAFKGIADWKNKGPQKNLRAVFSIYYESCSLMAAVDTGINSLEDLKGKRVCLGNYGSGHLGNSSDVLKSIGINPDTDIIARYIEPVQAPGLLQDGKIDAFFYTVGHPSGALKEAAAGARKVKFIPITGGEINKLVEERPYYSKMVIPINYYPGVENTHDVPTFGVCATLVTSSKISDKVVYAVTKTIFNDLEAFKKLHPAYALITKAGMLKCLSAPIHPGAMKYYREAGLK
ncbi:TAXI family TRAP transporter solute-binding subunit [Desulfococcaceae bacterium HSG9]|nr:TAXI family TRAP transporter solute-binding subunit [Desulfococcaceae bacterium HSG9]